MAAIFVLVMTLSLINLLLISGHMALFLTQVFQEKIDISVYFGEDTAEQDIFLAKEELTGFPEIKKVEYVSREMALQAFIQKHQGEEVLMESLREIGANPFLPSLNIKTRSANDYAAISDILDAASFKPLITKVDYFQKKPVIERFTSIADDFKRAGIILSAILSLIAVLLTFNQIRLTIYNAREEIEIMKLVGASNWFIRGPFLVEGIIMGIFAAAITLLIFTAGLYFLSPRLEAFLPGLNLFDYFLKNFLYFLLVQIAAGIGLGASSSSIAVRRYLKI